MPQNFFMTTTTAITLSDGRCLRGGETIGRGQRDERGVVGVRVGASSSPEREELEHRKGGNRDRPGSWVRSLSIRVRKIKASKTLNTLSD